MCCLASDWRPRESVASCHEVMSLCHLGSVRSQDPEHADLMSVSQDTGHADLMSVFESDLLGRARNTVSSLCAQGYFSSPTLFL